MNRWLKTYILYSIFSPKNIIHKYIQYYLGFDSEWPALSLFKNKPSIIQIATREKMYDFSLLQFSCCSCIFDLLALYVPANYQTLEYYYSLLNKNKIKQFWLGGAGDMRNLKK